MTEKQTFNMLQDTDETTPPSAPLHRGEFQPAALNTTYTQHGLVNIAKKKRELKSFQN